jgi:hypothetical protein
MMMIPNTTKVLLLEDELEPCAKPNDSYWDAVNKLIEHGS